MGQQHVVFIGLFPTEPSTAIRASMWTFFGVRTQMFFEVLSAAVQTPITRAPVIKRQKKNENKHLTKKNSK